MTVRSTSVRTIALAAALALVALVSGQGTAGAAWGGTFSNYATRVTAIDPAAPGVTAKAQIDGSYIVVTNTSATPLVIEGYQSEPYLRITDHGVWQNQLSPATFLNKEYYIDSIPSDVDAKDKPKWKKISSGDSGHWHDHRIHWMGATQPPNVAKDPGKAHLIKAWTIPVVAGTTPGVIKGTLTWRPSGHTATYLTVGGLVVALAIVLSLAVVRRRRLANRTAEAA